MAWFFQKKSESDDLQRLSRMRQGRRANALVLASDSRDDLISALRGQRSDVMRQERESTRSAFQHWFFRGPGNYQPGLCKASANAVLSLFYVRAYESQAHDSHLDMAEEHWATFTRVKERSILGPFWSD